jgi:hypothetical protein
MIFLNLLKIRDTIKKKILKHIFCSRRWVRKSKDIALDTDEFSRALPKSFGLSGIHPLQGTKIMKVSRFQS